MRRFIVRVLRFAIVLCLALALLVLVSAVRDANSLRRQLALRDGVSIVSIAHSHTQCAIDEGSWPTYQNLSTSATTPWWWYAKLDQMIQLNTNLPDIVIIEMGARDLEIAGQPDPARDCFVRLHSFALPLRRYWPFAEPPLTLGRIPDLFTYLKVILRTEFVSPTADMGSIADKDPGYVLTDRQIERLFSAPAEGVRFANSRALYFDRIRAIVETANQHRMKVVVLSTPVHPRFVRRAPALCKRERLECLEFAKTLPNVLVLDYWNAFNDDADFSDGDHLSTQGRLKFTALLKRELRERIPEGLA